MPRMTTLDKKLLETECIRNGNWVKLISILKHQFSEWSMARLAREGYADFKTVYMPVLMNISPEGTNNNDLANHARVTKQAMSKVAKELQKKGYIKAKIDSRDKRSTIFSLTDRGKKLVIEARYCVKDLSDEYQKLVGHAEFDQATEIIKKIIAFNDETILPKR
jgi:DNA-binding MarR family transcriptional regulator